nr:tRNA (cytosine(34)-C(5))-methyltransferase-like isoform X1 [Ipomoea batatas]
MGGRGRSRTQRKHFRQSRDNVWKRSKFDAQQPSGNSTAADAGENGNRNSKPAWEPFATQNPAFDEYYKEQGIVPPEEWDRFNEYLRSPLPAAFRINSSSQIYMDIRSKLENDFVKSLQAEITDGSEVEAIRPLPWYPEKLAWQSNFSRNELRKNQTLERFHEFLKLQNEIGNITRQEAVSMVGELYDYLFWSMAMPVPPLFLDVNPDHFVLDMCAAPGSKTFQLLEMIYHSVESGSLPSGMVIANDVDVQRCNLLIHQTKRMCTANLIVTNHEAQHFPSCHLNRHHAKGSEIRNVEDPDFTQLQYDRVLCDVPCSGDGTLRKAPDIWRKWNGGNGNGLHGLQVQIAMRGMSLLKVGGRMVYSTCSMNPIENEAVVAEVLRRCGESVELLDVSAEIPQLIRRPGLKRWKVRDRGAWLASYRDVPKSRRAAIVPGMFPSGKTHVDTSENGDDSTSILIDDGVNEDSKNGDLVVEELITSTDILEEEVSTLPLERCMRIVPHDQNTGAFFIAVFHKLSPLPALPKKPVNQPRKLHSNNDIQAEKLTTEVKEDTDLVQAKPTDISSVLPELTRGTDALDNEMMDDTAVDTESSIAPEENETEDIEPSNNISTNPDSSITPEENDTEDIEPSNNTSTNPEMVRGKRKLQIQGRWRGVDPVIFYKEETVVGKIKDFYGIKESFPFNGHLITRNSDINHVKRIYYISTSVKKVLELNFLGGQQLKIASVGLKMFERQTSKDGTSASCLFRISSEGLPLLLPHITKQILYASPVDFKHLLEQKSIKFANFVDAKLGEKASNLLLGCCVVILNKDGLEDTQVDASTVAIGCWRGRSNVSVMVTSLDCQELLERMSEYTEEDPTLSVSDSKPSAVDAQVSTLD